MGIKRREFIGGLGAGIALGVARCSGENGLNGTNGLNREPPAVGERYPGWRPGELDIHFIQTGVGEQTFFIFPDGTTMLLDCGDFYWEKWVDHTIPRRPSSERLGGEWVSRYVQRLMNGQAARSPSDGRMIDYFLLSHWHGDHCGNPKRRHKKLADGREVCGIALFAEDFGIRHYFDHQWPRAGVYKHGVDEDGLKMVHEMIPILQKRCGMEPHAFKVGALNQIALLHDAEGKYAKSFSIRNLFANAVYWDGKDGTFDYAPEYIKRNPKTKGGVNENSLSAGIRIHYGPFTAYFGGDIDYPDFEARLGPIVGPVDVCKTNHHACPSSMGAPFCAAVRAQAYMTSVWSPSQINSANLPHMTSRELYPGDRIVMLGNLPEMRRAHYADRPFMKDILPAQGHSVFKVAPGGKTFDAFVLTDTDESMRILYVRRFTSGANAKVKV